ncbi:SAM-dependent methyltransferase [Larkinella sp. VNQ87]|uniref:SAM-dependent methyltransferase n=1 Tax=Larkinella sp. VNQ87 TaxID=3400921 RepID=UPI003C0D147A
MPSLYLIPTVLAENTAEQVLSPQIRAVVGQTKVFFVENVRTARRFISSLKTGVVIDELTFYELNKDTPETETAGQLRRLLLEQQDAGILSEAGCPGVADPGAVAVRLAHQMGWRVWPLVGPSSILLALMASGMSGQSFAFHGYLPIEKPARLQQIRQLEQDARKRDQTQIFMETPYRNNALLADLLATCHPETRLCIACHLTADDELIRTLSIREWKTQVPDLHKKPSLFLLL